MKTYIIYWKNKKGEKLTTFEEAESVKKALKQVSYFEKKTKYEITGINEYEATKENEILLD